MRLILSVMLGKTNQGEYVLDDQAQQAYVIGNQTKADITLLGDRICANHAVIRYVQGQWQIKVADGELVIAGSPRTEHALTDGTLVSIGPYLLKFSLLAQRQEADQASAVSKPVDSVKQVQTDDGTATGIIKDKARNLGTVFAKLSQGGSNKRAAFLLAVCVLIWLYLGLSESSHTETQNPVPVPDQVTAENATPAVQTQNESVSVGQGRSDEAQHNGGTAQEGALTLADKRVAQRYIQWAQQLASEGELEQAFLRLQAGHKLIKHHGELKAALEQSRTELIMHYQQQQQYSKALGILEPVKDDSLERTQIYEQVKKQLDQHKVSKNKLEQEKQKLFALSSRYQSLLDKHQFASLRSQVRELDAALIASTQELESEYRKIIEQIDQREQAYYEQQHTEKTALKTQQLTRRDYFMQCIHLAQSQEYAQAFNACNKAKKGAQLSADMQLEINHWQDYLRTKYESQIEQYITTAENCLDTENMKCAFDNWQRVIDFDNARQDIKDRLESVTATQLKKASELYKTAKAYEDLGYNDKAISSLDELFRVLPLSDQSIYKKAQNLKLYLQK